MKSMGNTSCGLGGGQQRALFHPAVRQKGLYFLALSTMTFTLCICTISKSSYDGGHHKYAGWSRVDVAFCCLKLQAMVHCDWI